MSTTKTPAQAEIVRAIRPSESWRSLVAECRIPARSKGADRMLARHERRFYADGVDPIEFQCNDCGQRDDRITTNRDEWAKKTCSNCYSERVLIVGIRLTFHNWGEQNGGAKERDDRYEHALQIIAEHSSTKRPQAKKSKQ